MHCVIGRQWQSEVSFLSHFEQAFEIFFLGRFEGRWIWGIEECTEETLELRAWARFLQTH